MRVLVEAFLRIDDEDDVVGILGAAPGRIDHGPLEPLAWLEDAGRVDQHDLADAFDGDAADLIARRLDLMGDDRHLGADQRIDQRRFAGIRRPDDGDENAAAISGRRARGDRLRSTF